MHLLDLHDFMMCMSFQSYCVKEETDWKLLQLLEWQSWELNPETVQLVTCQVSGDHSGI